MLEPQFFALIAIAIFSYGIQIPLLVHFVRKTDGLIVTVYRNLSLGLTMLPVLFFVPLSEVMSIISHIPTLLLASGFGAFAFIVNLNASKYLAVGVTSSIRQVVYVTVAIILGFLFLDEHLTFFQLVLLAGILSGGITLTLSKSSHTHLNTEDAWKGVVLAMVGGVGYALSFLYFSILSREISPWVAGYFWELTIGIIAFLYWQIRIYINNEDNKNLFSVREVVTIAAISLATIAGTVSYGFAVNFGPYALASGLVTTTVLITTLISWFLFKEKLTPKQLLLISTVVILIFLLRVVS